MTAYSDTQGQRVDLGEVVGRGGEGTVYRILGNSAQVAKIYHENLTASRAEKIEAMVTVPSPSLLEFACWPVTALYGPRRRFVGYLMANLGECSAIHELYNPK